MKRLFLLSVFTLTVVEHFFLPYAAMAEHRSKDTHPPPNIQHTRKSAKNTEDERNKKSHRSVLLEELPHHIETEAYENELEELDELKFVFFYYLIHIDQHNQRHLDPNTPKNNQSADPIEIKVLSNWESPRINSCLPQSFAVSYSYYERINHPNSQQHFSLFLY